VVDWLSRLIDSENLPLLREREREASHRYDGSTSSSSPRRFVKRSRDNSSTPTSQPDGLYMSPSNSILPATPDSGSISLTTPGGLFGAGVIYQHPPQPQTMPPPLPQSSPRNVTQYLPAFNIKCAQHHLLLDYQAEFSGPPHAGRWTVSCFGE
jgi:hypothetical protein